MNCPKCNGSAGEVLADEVDIGVGVLRHVFGFDCPDCGQLGVHSCCGGWDFSGHAAWCAEAPGN